MPKHGYFNAIHVFGRSKLVRTGGRCILQWQWTKNMNMATGKAVPITKKQYDAIKGLLGPVLEKEDHKTTVRIFHMSLPIYYMRVKRYLKREGIL